MRILVIGATGLRGKEIVKLVSPGHEVIGPSRKGSTSRGDLRRGRHMALATLRERPPKVDRFAAYMARFLAEQVVACGRPSRCLVQLKYEIGMAEPVSFAVELFGTGTQLESKILEGAHRRIRHYP